MGCIINIDTGGTFSDGFLSWHGETRSVKTLTTPHDLTVCFVNCLQEGARAYGVAVEALLRDTSVIRFSTTLGTNTVIQRSGPKLGLLVSPGHDRDLYATAGQPSGLEFLVAPEMVRAADVTDREAVLAAIQDLVDSGARAIVVSLAGSDRDPAGEQAIKGWLAEAFPQECLGTPQTFVASDLSDRAGDAVRTNTALLNAYIHRDMARNLYRAEEQARRRFYSRPLLVAHAGGGCARVAKTQALHTLNSGPAGGLAGIDFLRRAYGYENVLSADMGGTSVDLAVIRGGTLPRDETPVVAGLRVHQPMLYVLGIGAGGGSIARVQGGRLTVGPESAGAAPGPACFDLGGTQPTVTDADLVLGYLDPDYFLGGRMQLSRGRAETAIRTHVAQPLGLGLEAAALAIRTEVDATIGAALRKLMVEEGETIFQPQALFCFGGAGPTHAAGFARALGIPRLITSPHAAVFSAFGLSQLDITHSYTWSPRRPVPAGNCGPFSDSELSEQLAVLQGQAVRDMRGEGFPPGELTWQVEVLITGPDGTEARLNQPGCALTTTTLTQLADEARSRWGNPAAVELTAVVLTATAAVPRFHLVPHEDGSADPGAARKGTRRAWWQEGGSTETPVYDRSLLRPGQRIVGPALVESLDTTCVVPPGWQYTIDPYLSGVLEEAST